MKGKRISLKNLLQDSTKIWCRETVFWYGGETRNVEYLSITCLWNQAGKTPVKLRVILVKTPDGKNAAEAFFSTDIDMAPADIIKNFVLRWNLEVTFEETRAHLGIETQRQWSDKSIARTTPLLMGLFSFVTLVAFPCIKPKHLLVWNWLHGMTNRGSLHSQISWQSLGVQFGQISIF